MAKISAAKQQGPQMEKLPVSGPVLVLLLVSRDTMVKVESNHPVTHRRTIHHDFFLSPTITNHFVGGGSPAMPPPRKWVSAPEFPPHYWMSRSLFRMQLKHADDGLAEPLAPRMALFCLSFLHFMGCISTQTAPVSSTLESRAFRANPQAASSGPSWLDQADPSCAPCRCCMSDWSRPCVHLRGIRGQFQAPRPGSFLPLLQLAAPKHSFYSFCSFTFSIPSSTLTLALDNF